MGRMVMTAAAVVVVVVVALLAYAATRPDSYHVERMISVRAPTSRVFARLNDFHAWSDWSPWAKLDPAMKQTFDGPQKGVGTRYAWESDKVGAGEMILKEVRDDVQLVIELHFIKPFESRSTATFTLAQNGPETAVTWSMDGELNFFSKLMGIFISMDRMIGKDFEQGLADLKTVVETDDARAGADTTPSP